MADTTKGNNDARTIFVGGISWSTESKDLQEYFVQFGAISRVYLKTDPNTGQHGGFGFVAFVSPDAVEEVLKNGPHTVKGKLVDAKRANARPGIKKIFVGGLPSDMPEADVRTYFEKFGKVEAIELPFDQATKQRRRFCFIVFESESSVNEVCKMPKQKIGNRVCDIRKAVKPDQRSTSGGGAYGQSQGPGAQGFNQYNQGYGYANFGDYGSSAAYGGGYGQGPTLELQHGSMPSNAPAYYDYSGWNYGQGENGGEYGQQPWGLNNGRIGRGGANTRGASGYHPYNS